MAGDGRTNSTHEILMGNWLTCRQIEDAFGRGTGDGRRLGRAPRRCHGAKRGGRGGRPLTFWRRRHTRAPRCALPASPAVVVRCDACKGTVRPPLRPHPPRLQLSETHRANRDGRLRGTNEQNDTSALPSFPFPRFLRSSLIFSSLSWCFFPSSLSQSPPSFLSLSLSLFFSFLCSEY